MHYKIIKLTEQVFSFTADVKKRFLDLGRCISLTFYCSFLEVGCALSKTPSELPTQCYRNGLWGGVGTVVVGGGAETRGGCDTRQVYHNQPISCSQLFHLSGKLSVKRSALSFGVSGCEYPVTSGWWKDVNILLVFWLLICSLTHHIMADGRLPKGWNCSPESRWLPESEQVDRAIERTRGMQRRKGRLDARRCERKKKVNGGYSMQTARERRAEHWEGGDPDVYISGAEMAWSVCDQRWDGLNSEVTLTVELGLSYTRRSPRLRSSSLHLTFKRMQQSISYSSTARSQLLDTITQRVLTWLTRWWNKKRKKEMI